MEAPDGPASCNEFAMKRAAAILIACLVSAAPLAAQTPDGEAAKDAARLVECVNKNAGADGGPQACVGLLYEECMKGSGDARSCNRREGLAWMDALKRGAADRKRFAARNMEVYDNAVRRVRGQARALCHAAAAVSSWASEAVANGTFERSDIDMSGCEREAIAQQALVILVTSRRD